MGIGFFMFCLELIYMVVDGHILVFVFVCVTVLLISQLFLLYSALPASILLFSSSGRSAQSFPGQQILAEAACYLL